MGPFTAVESVLFKSFNFRGRAPRAEYWWWWLFHFVILSALVWFDLSPMLTAESPDISQVGYSSGIFMLLGFFPGLAVTIRRLHDSGRSGFWYFIVAVPVIGPLWFLFLMLSPSQLDDNIYGPPWQDSGRWKGKSEGKRDPMQAYAILDRLHEKPTPEMIEARKQEINDYYRSRVLQS